MICCELMLDDNPHLTHLSSGVDVIILDPNAPLHTSPKSSWVVNSGPKSAEKSAQVFVECLKLTEE